MRLLTTFQRRGGDQPDFTGKVVAIYCGSEGSGGVFEDVRLVQIGFSNFVVGRKIMQEPSQQERWSNVTVWIGINEISRMCVFDDIEAARRAFEPAEA